ncbi:DUF402 domain-containing protein [Marinicrinis lubricantis]|uniref:DUF402 domain-containing protein n=1 Tax=Marinicrinis lubricantis TaxID=2086470 RepID=A0ABW1IR89_9BACL
MDSYLPYIIKSFKHDGHLHRMWKENWLIPGHKLRPEHRNEGIHVLINDQTPIQEANGSHWVSRIPGISFFIPKQWFNVVALIEEGGIRYYCNIASPPYNDGSNMTYIDYDLDVVVTHHKQVHVLDEAEYELHKHRYNYSPLVEEKVERGLESVIERIRRNQAPFQDEAVIQYYEEWKNGNTDQ